jgi:hypothetical protein
MSNNNTFSFKKNTDINALPDAKPEVIQPLPKTKNAKPAKVKKDKQVSAYLSQEEWEIFNEKLDGRTMAGVLRNLVLEYCKK